MNAQLLETAKALPLSEKIELAEALWSDIADQGYEPAITAAQEAELDRRIEAHRRDPQAVIPWEQIQAELRQKYPRAQ